MENFEYWFEKISGAHEAMLKNDYATAGILLGEMRMEMIYLRKDKPPEKVKPFTVKTQVGEV